MLVRKILVCSLICLISKTSPAQMDRVYRSVRALSDKEIQLALFGRANTRECKSLPLPDIHVIEAPEHGTLTVRVATLATNQYPSCPNLKLQAQVLLYKSVSNYIGSDAVSFTVRFEKRTATTADSALILLNITNFQAALVISAITRSGAMR